jgi:hypothetical protein
MKPFTDRPLASAGLTSYRYKGRYGWIMIGAKDHTGALSEAVRSMSNPDGAATLDNLQVWDEPSGVYVPIGAPL